MFETKKMVYHFTVDHNNNVPDRMTCMYMRTYCECVLRLIVKYHIEFSTKFVML